MRLSGRGTGHVGGDGKVTMTSGGSQIEHLTEDLRLTKPQVEKDTRNYAREAGSDVYINRRGETRCLSSIAGIRLMHLEALMANNMSPIRGERQTQARYLRELQRRVGLRVREIARRSRVFAESLGEPKTAFGHQAVSAWLNGTRNPRPEHRRILAMIFHVPLDEFNRGCDGPTSEIDADSILKPVIVHVQGHDQAFDYSLTIKSGVDISRPAIFQHWTDLFDPWPAPLVKHFGRTTASLFGLVPDRSLSPLIRYAHSLVPIDTNKTALQDESSIDKKIWFVYLPDGQLEVGVAFRDGRWIVISKPHVSGYHMQKYPLSRVDLIGWVTGKTLFHLDLAVS